jgi:SAM-dependent methyltransferase
MPFSNGAYKNNVKKHFQTKIEKGTKILDVGAGSGTYADLFKGLGYHIDCLEIWEPYVNQFNLREKYENVIIGDIRDFDFSKYDYIVMGDVLEHLTFNDAKIVLDKINESNKKCLIAVPYNYEQGSYEGNVYETHLQPDLTPSLMLERYPSLKLIFGDGGYGYYVNYEYENRLTRIANKQTTDKGTVHYEAHGYTEIYGEYIPPVGKFKLFEIGIWHGDSIRMWNEYNPDIDVYALDINPNVFNFLKGSEKFKIYIGNQSDESYLLNILNEANNDFDFVIDDGSHNHDDILNSFRVLFPKMKKGSIYFIEDLHATSAQKNNLVKNLFSFISDSGIEISKSSFYCDEKLLMIKK